MTEYLIATSVLEEIVRGSLEPEERVRPHSAMLRTHPAEVTVKDDSCKVVVQLDALMGESLPDLAVGVRTRIVDALGPMTGLSVSTVDVVFGGIFSAGS